MSQNKQISLFFITYRKVLLSTGLFLLCITLSAQTEPGWLTGFSLKGQLENSTVSAYAVYQAADENRDNPVYYSYNALIVVYPNGGKMDTLTLDTFTEEISQMDTCFLQAVQMDGKGEKELIITFTTYEKSYWGEHGLYFMEKTTQEVWDLDSRKRLFSALSKYHYYSDCDYYVKRNRIVYNNILIDCAYTYDLDFSEPGKITVSNYQKKYTSNCRNFPPDKKEGTYVFQNGGFVRKKRLKGFLYR